MHVERLGAGDVDRVLAAAGLFDEAPRRTWTERFLRREGHHLLVAVVDGADVLDVGGESTRPGSDPVEAGEESERVVPVVEGLAARVDVPISVDTRRAEVAASAIEAGASIVNDVTAGRDPDMFGVVARAGVGLVLMHMRGEPDTMQRLTDYGYRAIHETTVKAKELLAKYYGKAADYNYFNGCSTGGRQGLMEAQRFPDDYDGIVTGAPSTGTGGGAAPLPHRPRWRAPHAHHCTSPIPPISVISCSRSHRLP